MKVGVIGIVIHPTQNQILAIKRCDVPIWTLPGGGVEKNEGEECAVVREIFEETGVEAKVIRLVGVYNKTTWLTGNVKLYECELVGGAPIIGKETREIGFFPLDNLPSPFFPLHLAFIKDAMLKKSSPIERPIPVNWSTTLIYGLKHPIFTIRFLLSKIGCSINTK